MANWKSWLLTDVEKGIYLDNWEVTSASLGLNLSPGWSLRRRTLRGGLTDGVDVVEVDNGALSYTVVPTRGMGIWRGRYRGWLVGWNSPVKGPVHPKFVNLDANGGIGWLAGFDEWIVRCGLDSNGAPGKDTIVDNQGNKREVTLPLHGRIANLPAHRVSVRVNLDPPHEIEVMGEVDESMLFFPQLRLATCIRTVPNSNKLELADVITNLRSQPAEFELLYHCNFGRPLMGPGARMLAPIRSVAPRDAHAAKHMETFADYPSPHPGVTESVYFFDLLSESKHDHTLAALVNPKENKACAIRWRRSQLPWFTLWKNPGAESDGYVTGLEPATNLPNPRQFERERKRVPKLPPGGQHRTHLMFEILDNKPAIDAIAKEIHDLQGQATSTMFREPSSRFSPH